MKNRLNQDSGYKIAVVRTDGLGDMILTLPICRALKEINSNFQITLLASSYTAPVLENNPFIDNVIFIDKSINSICKIFRENKFDIVFFPRPKFEESLAAFVSLIKYRVGSGYRWYSFLYNKKVFEHRKDAKFNEAEYNLHLVEHFFDLKLELKPTKLNASEEAIQSLKKKINNIYFDIEKKNYLVIHPGSKASAKDWPSINFGYLASEIIKECDVKIVITGVAGEFELCDNVNSVCTEAFNLCGKLSLPETIALISKAKLFISNSTGVLHIAAALGVPVIGLYPNTPHISRKRWGPLTEKSTIISPPQNSLSEYNDDMSQITVQTVFNAATKWLKDLN